MIEILELDEFAEICNMCRKKTDKDPEYSQNEKYEEPISTKKNNLSDDNLQNLSNDNNLQNELIEIK